MDALPTDDNPPFFRMEDFSTMQSFATPLPWAAYGIRTDPFYGTSSPAGGARPMNEQEGSEAAAVAAATGAVPAAAPAAAGTVQPTMQLRKIAPKPAAPSQGHDVVRNNFRDVVTEALKMVITEQPREKLMALFTSERQPAGEEGTLNFETDGLFSAEDSLEAFQSRGRYKLQVFGGKGSTGVAATSDVCKQIGADEEENGITWEERMVEHAKMVAKDVEIELLRVHKSVDKKYREKARSLSFNLKDKNNPELRARVFAGEIAPQTLCLMTTEQLASKELSQWRMEKAEERAQMVVITDEDVNPSKIVKKTHKGEVIIDSEDNAADFATGVKSVTGASQSSREANQDVENPDADVGVDLKGFSQQPEQRSEETGVESPVENVQTANPAELPESSDLLDASDFKGLPEIMSMDGFMKSLGTENDGSGDEDMNDANEASDGGSEDDAAKRELSEEKEEGPAETNAEKTLETTKEHAAVENVEKEEAASASPVKDSSSPKSLKRKEPDSSALEGAETKSQELWRGNLQLSGTRSAGVHVVYRSGQEVKLSGWPKSLEIKGRVKLGPLAKFLKDLCMSKSRAVTVVGFCLNDVTSSSSSYLKEMAEQYSKGERVGYVVPGTGYELYLFPPGKSTWKFLTENGRLKPSTDVLADKSALVGCIVWRKTSSDSDKPEKKQSTSTTTSSSNKKSKLNQVSSIKPRSSSSKRPQQQQQQQSYSSSNNPKASPSSLPPPPPSSSPAVLTNQVNALSELLLPPSAQPTPSSSSLFTGPAVSTALQSVVQHSVNEWPQQQQQHQQALVAAGDSFRPPTVPAAAAASGPQYYQHQHAQGLPPGFGNSNNSNLMLPPALSSLYPGARLPGFEGPPGQWESRDDDLPEFDFEAHIKGMMLYPTSSHSSTATAPPPPPPLPMTSTTATSTTTGMLEFAGTAGGGGGGLFPQAAAGAGANFLHHPMHQQQHQHQHQTDMMRFANDGMLQLQQQLTNGFQHPLQRPPSVVGAPPLPPGPPPPHRLVNAFRSQQAQQQQQQQQHQWIHPNQATHQKYKKGSSGSGNGSASAGAGGNTQRRYRN